MSRKVYLISCGVGGYDDITVRALKTIDSCDIVMGAERFITLFAGEKRSVILPANSERAAEIVNRADGTIGVLLSGDVGFYSQAATLRKLITDAEIESIAGVGIVQQLSAKLDIAWQDLEFVSLHADSSNQIPDGDCMILMRRGLNLKDLIPIGRKVMICQALSTPDEKIELWGGGDYLCNELTTIIITAIN
ncbi:MAG: cobalt-precorrin-7 (C(5))-methyltransferase [Deferribacteraceae bacterium]|jgi:precorrin-6B methylase 1|nr:cobalt-precorrin-7 (C(5))-methyltransferase [Deferribacteraceae bacterium]